MSKYIMVYTSPDYDGICRHCDFAGKMIKKFDSINEVQKAWHLAMYNGQHVDIYKKVTFKLEECE